MAAKVQFSLRTIFVVTAVVAVLAAEAVALPEIIAGIGGFVVTMLQPSAFVAQIVYGRAAARAFGVGALSTWLTVISVIKFLSVEMVDGGRIDYCILWSMMLAGGGVACLVRWLSMRT
ncbi:MAG TPA: hypothetical protein VJ783_07435 [Pirellulales bacterium]|nr:hypothetical protein [Pirellulales bacterium]